MASDEVLHSELVFDGRLIDVRVDTVRLADGQVHQREVVEHPGAVAVLAALPSGELILVRQYRHAVGRVLLELPAGTREPGEGPEACALRELAEETGYQAASVRELVRFFVSPGWANEELIVYVADGVRTGAAQPEADEQIEVVPVRPETVPDLIRRGEIADSKTVAGLLAYLGIALRPG